MGRAVPDEKPRSDYPNPEKTQGDFAADRVDRLRARHLATTSPGSFSTPPPDAEKSITTYRLDPRSLQ